MQIKLNRHLAMLALSCAALSPLSALAADGTITFQGNITNSTCVVSTSGGTANMTVTMPFTVSSALSKPGSTSQTVPFAINVSKCSPTMGASVFTYFESANINPATGALKNTVTSGGATNVEIQILEKGAPLFLAMDANGQGSGQTSVSISNGGAVRNYGARYFSTGPITSGLVNTSTQYTVIYQ